MNLKIESEDYNNEIIYYIKPSLQITFFKDSEDIDLTMTNPKIQTFDKICNISKALDYITHNKNWIGILCTCFLNDTRNCEIQSTKFFDYSTSKTFLNNCEVFKQYLPKKEEIKFEENEFEKENDEYKNIIPIKSEIKPIIKEEPKKEIKPIKTFTFKKYNFKDIDFKYLLFIIIILLIIIISLILPKVENKEKFVYLTSNYSNPKLNFKMVENIEYLNKKNKEAFKY